MPEQLIHVDPSKPLARLLTLLALALALLWTVFTVRWYVGNTIAEFLNPDENGADSARLAVSLAPDDPLSHWRLGDFIEKKLPPDQIAQAVSEYEKATSLSPNDYRFWLGFGRALEQAGEMGRGEKALRRAVELAPSYSYPRWYLGNLLLRSGRYPEAFAELQRASEADPELRPQLFNLAWEVFKDDFDSLKSAAGTTGEARAEFSVYLLGRERFEDGLRLWAGLSDAEKRNNRTAAGAIINALVVKHRFHQGVSVWNDIAPSPIYRAEMGQILDGGFETGVSHSAVAVFGWQVQSIQQAQVAIDPNLGHDGSRSLRIVFQVHSRLDSINVAQIISVEPGTQYDLEYYVKTQKLESAATPIVAILDAMDDSALASSPPAATGSTDWQRVALSFKTGPKTEAIILRINRDSCGENTVCPMFGTIWYDDFNLKPGS
jgi:tetratricopeptide (TPR) repeat protein